MSLETGAEPNPNPNNKWLGLLAEHNEVFHCLHEGKFLVSSR